MESQLDTVKDKFNNRWNSYTKGYTDFTNKMKDRDYVVQSDIAISQVNRALLTDEHIQKNYDKGSNIVEIGCGNGFNPCYLKQEGYEVTAFDLSSSAIEQSCELAESLGLPKDMFHIADHSFFETLEENSVDAVIALGVMRYLEDPIREQIYQQVYRILKPGGCFLVSNDNQLFEIFAMNDGTINFWSEVIQGFSDMKELIPDSTLEDELKKEVHLPQRKYAAHSVSQHVKRHMENPLTYNQVVEAYGFKLDKVFYPDSHILPPFLEKKVDNSVLETIKGKICLSRAEGDWRAMFMDCEFVSVLKK